MKKTSKLCLALIVLVVIAGCSYQPRIVASKKIKFSPSPSDVVKVMTFNIRVDTIIDGFNRWANRKNIVFDVIRDNAADIIGLQEALAKQVKQIQQALPQYTNYMVSRNDGKRKGESCAIFYRKDRFKLVDSGTFWFSDTPYEPGSKDWGNFPPRICSWLHLREKTTYKRFYVYNLHLDNLSQNSRKKSVKLLAKKIANRKTNEPFIVMGDFNMELDNPAMKFLLQKGYNTPYPKMVDAWQSLNPGRIATGTRGGFKGKTTGPRIDHIPISENTRALEIKVDRRSVNGRYPSDHFPVIAKILLGNVAG